MTASALLGVYADPQECRAGAVVRGGGSRELGADATVVPSPEEPRLPWSAGSPVLLADIAPRRALRADAVLQDGTRSLGADGAIRQEAQASLASDGWVKDRHELHCSAVVAGDLAFPLAGSGRAFP